jgi:hypothetical protein
LGQLRQGERDRWSIENWTAFEAHLDQWTCKVTDRCELGQLGIRPADHFVYEPRTFLPGWSSPFGSQRDLVRKAKSDCAVEFDTSGYSVPWRPIGDRAQVVVPAGRFSIRHAGQMVADHSVCGVRRQRIADRAHFVGLVSEERLMRAAISVEVSGSCKIAREPGGGQRWLVMANIDDGPLIAKLSLSKLTAGKRPKPSADGPSGARGQ